MEPIVLSQYGETLIENPAFKKGDDDDLNGQTHVVGTHQHCRGAIERVTVSSTHFALICNDCNLRVVIPNRVKTFARLRRFFKRFQS